MSFLSEMRKKINLKDLAENGQLDGNSIQRAAKLEKIAVFSEIKSEHPKLSNKEICDLMETTPSTMLRIRKDLAVKSPYRYDISAKSKKSVELSEVEISTLRSANLSDAEKERLNQYTTMQKQKEIEKQNGEGNHRITLRDLKNRCIELHDNTPTVSKPIKGKTITTSRNKTATHEVNPSAGSLEKPVIDGDYLDNLLPKT
jgi:hypothetical protein